MRPEHGLLLEADLDWLRVKMQVSSLPPTGTDLPYSNLEAADAPSVATHHVSYRYLIPLEPDVRLHKTPGRSYSFTDTTALSLQAETRSGQSLASSQMLLAMKY